MDKQGLLVGIVVGLAVGIMVEKFARARRDLIALKKSTGVMRSSYRRYYAPRMIIYGFIGVCATIAAFRILLGTAE